MERPKYQGDTVNFKTYKQSYKSKKTCYNPEEKWYLDLDELTPAVLNDMVKAVYVHKPDKSKEHREQQIDISYDFVRILPASLLNGLQNGETA